MNDKLTFTMVVNVSGGKDSQAMLYYVAMLAKANGWHERMLALHCDLGRAEWPQSKAMCQAMSKAVGAPLHVVERSGGLIEYMQRRMATLHGTGKPFWPSAAARYCTSEFKTKPANAFMRGLGKDKLVISALGLRAEESVGRAGRQVWSVNKEITASHLRELPPQEALEKWLATGQKGRLGLIWLPIHGWSVETVYSFCGHSMEELARRREQWRGGLKESAMAGWNMHPAYIYGNQRVSCMLCVLATRNDLTVGARQAPDLWAEYIKMEDEGGATFKHKFSLNEVSPYHSSQSELL